MPNYMKRATFGFIWLAAAGVVSNIFGYLLRLFLARNLTVEEYGLVYAIFALFGLIAIFQNFGLAESIVKHVSGYRAKKQDKKVREVLVWSIGILYATSFVLALITIFFADWIALAYFGDVGTALLIRIYAVSFALYPISFIILSSFQGAQRMDVVAYYNVIQSIFLLIITASLFAVGYGILGAVLAYVVFYIIQHIIFIPIFVRFFFREKKVTISTKIPKKLLTYGIPIMFTGVGVSIVTYTDTILITIFSSLEQVGLYQVALPTATILKFFMTVLTTVLFPLIADMAERKLFKRIGTAVADVYKYTFVFMVPLVIGVLVYPEFILNLLFGAHYVAASTILQVLAIAILFITLNAVNVAALSGIGKPKDTMKAVWIGVGINIVGNLLLIPKYGGLGASIATLISVVFVMYFSTYYLQKEIPLTFPVHAGLRTLFAGMAFLFVLSSSRVLFVNMNQFVKIGVAGLLGGLIYLGLIFLFRVITREEIDRIRQQVSKR